MSFTSGVPERSRWSDVYISSAIQLFGATGAFLVMVTLVLGIEAEGGSGVQVALLIVAEMLPMVLLGRNLGKVVDRFDSRLILVLGGIGQTLACLLLVNAQTFPMILVGGVALATVTAFVGTTRNALLPSMVTREDLPKAAAIGQTASSMGMMLGPALAGILVGTSDVRRTLTVAAFGFLATVVAGLTLRTRRGRGAATVDSPEGTVKSDWRLSDDRLFQAAVWGLALVVSAISAVNVAAVFFIRGTLGSTPVMFGVVEAMWTAGMLAGAWLCARLIRPVTTDNTLVRWMFFAFMGVCALVALSGTVPTVLWLIPCYLLGGIGNGFENVLMGTLLGRRTPEHARGQASATLQSRVNGGALIGFVGGGLLLEIIDPRWIFVGAGLLGAVAAVVIAPFVFRIAASHEKITISDLRRGTDLPSREAVTSALPEAAAAAKS